MECSIYKNATVGLGNNMLDSQKQHSETPNKINFGGVFMAENNGGVIKNDSGNDGAGILALNNPTKVETYDAIKATPESLSASNAKTRQLLEQCQLILGYGNSRVNAYS